jgi:hypothetical protein
LGSRTPGRNPKELTASSRDRLEVDLGHVSHPARRTLLAEDDNAERAELLRKRRTIALVGEQDLSVA